MSDTSVAALQFPRLRTDLVVTRQGANGTVSFIVKDPVTARFFRFRETEGFLLEQLDGRTSLAELRTSLETRFSATLSLRTLEEFVGRLHGLGLLLDEAGALPS